MTVWAGIITVSLSNYRLSDHQHPTVPYQEEQVNNNRSKGVPAKMADALLQSGERSPGAIDVLGNIVDVTTDLYNRDYVGPWWHESFII